MEENGHSRFDQLLDLLADEVARRLQARSEVPRPEPIQDVPTVAAVAPGPEAPPAPVAEPALPSAPEPALEIAPDAAVAQSSHAASLMARLAFGVLMIIVLINIPLNAQGTAIARSIPNSASLIIGDGLVVKESNSPEIWVYRNGSFHWITTLDAFEYFGYRWQDVHIVEPGFLTQFVKGEPIYVLLKCEGSPHIYQPDQGHKRWIVDIPTFESQGYVWEDVKFVPCYYLRNLPDGESIPPGRGSPPPPLP